MPFLSLWNKGSPKRHTFLPSNCTSKEYIINSHVPFILLLTTPSAAPASSPVDIMYLASWVMGIWPSVVTEVGPEEVSADCPMLGYGIGTGPAGVGVLQTSGKIGLIPPLPLCAIPRQLAN